MTTVTFVICDVLRGGFGTMPAFTADYSGPKMLGDLWVDADGVEFCQRFGPLYIAACERPREIIQAHSTHRHRDVRFRAAADYRQTPRREPINVMSLRVCFSLV